MLSGQGISTPSLLNMAQVKPTYQIETKIRHKVNPNLEIPRKENSDLSSNLSCQEQVSGIFFVNPRINFIWNLNTKS